MMLVVVAALFSVAFCALLSTPVAADIAPDAIIPATETIYYPTFVPGVVHPVTGFAVLAGERHDHSVWVISYDYVRNANEEHLIADVHNFTTSGGNILDNYKVISIVLNTTGHEPIVAVAQTKGIYVYNCIFDNCWETAVGVQIFADTLTESQVEIRINPTTWKPLVVFLNSSSHINVFSCTDNTCSSGTLTDVGVVANEISFDFNPNTGFASIAYTNTSGGVGVVSCGDADCTSSTAHYIASHDTNMGTALRFNPVLGAPQVAFWRIGDSNTRLEFVTCTNPACSVISTQIHHLLADPVVDVPISMAINSTSGFAVLGLTNTSHTGNNALRVFACYDTHCTFGYFTEDAAHVFDDTVYTNSLDIDQSTGRVWAAFYEDFSTKKRVDYPFPLDSSPTSNLYVCEDILLCAPPPPPQVFISFCQPNADVEPRDGIHDCVNITVYDEVSEYNTAIYGGGGGRRRTATEVTLELASYNCRDSLIVTLPNVGGDWFNGVVALHNQNQGNDDPANALCVTFSDVVAATYRSAGTAYAYISADDQCVVTAQQRPAEATFVPGRDSEIQVWLDVSIGACSFEARDVGVHWLLPEELGAAAAVRCVGCDWPLGYQLHDVTWFDDEIERIPRLHTVSYIASWPLSCWAPAAELAMGNVTLNVSEWVNLGLVYGNDHNPILVQPHASLYTTMSYLPEGEGLVVGGRDNALFEVTVYNEGPSCVREVTIDDPQPPLSTFEDYRPWTWTCTPSSGASCGVHSATTEGEVVVGSGDVLLDVAIGAHDNVTVLIDTGIINHCLLPSTLRNDVNVTVQDVGLVTDDWEMWAHAEARTTSIADIRIRKTDHKKVDDNGDYGTFDIYVEHVGGWSCAHDVELDDHFDFTEFAEVEWTCTPSRGSVCPRTTGRGPITGSAPLIEVGGYLHYSVSFRRLFGRPYKAENTIDGPITFDGVDPWSANDNAYDQTKLRTERCLWNQLATFARGPQHYDSQFWSGVDSSARIYPLSPNCGSLRHFDEFRVDGRGWTINRLQFESNARWKDQYGHVVITVLKSDGSGPDTSSAPYWEIRLPVDDGRIDEIELAGQANHEIYTVQQEITLLRGEHLRLVPGVYYISFSFTEAAGVYWMASTYNAEFSSSSYQSESYSADCYYAVNGEQDPQYAKRAVDAVASPQESEDVEVIGPDGVAVRSAEERGPSATNLSFALCGYTSGVVRVHTCLEGCPYNGHLNHYP
jgi:hypothetical protein